MGHYASEMGYSPGHQAALKAIDKALSLGFKSAYDRETKWSCGVCAALVCERDVQKHMEWHADD